MLAKIQGKVYLFFYRVVVAEKPSAYKVVYETVNRNLLKELFGECFIIVIASFLAKTILNKLIMKTSRDS